VRLVPVSGRSPPNPTPVSGGPRVTIVRPAIPIPENPPLSSKEYPESESSWALAHALAALATRGRSPIRKAENVDGGDAKIRWIRRISLPFDGLKK